MKAGAENYAKAVMVNVSDKSARQRTPRKQSNKPACKIHRILTALMKGETMNFVEAQRRHHDRTLHSTISEIQIDYGIDVSREWETIPGFMGEPTRCRRYSLTQDQREKAAALLEGLE